MFGNREFRVKMVKSEKPKTAQNAIAAADAIVPSVVIDPDRIADTTKEVVFYTAYTITAAIVISTIAITAGKVTTIIAKSIFK